jgi:hypothetical protein
MHWKRNALPYSTVKTKRWYSKPQFSNLTSRWWTKSRTPVILSVIHFRQDPLDSTWRHYFRTIQIQSLTDLL